LACLLVLQATAIFAQQTSVFHDPGELIAELRRLETSLGQTPLADDWIVDANGRSYSISTAPLRQILGKRMDDKIVAREWLENLVRELEPLESTSFGGADAHGQLTKILARREFAAARPPSAGQRIMQYIIDWIAAVIRRIVNFADGHPTTGTILFWVLAALAAGFLGYFVLRFWTRKSMVDLPRPETSLPAWNWQKWVMAAREAGARGDLRTAIHCAYWGAVVRLQEYEVLPRALTRTPREYLRLDPDRAASRAPLASITGALERFWYASRPAGPGDLQQSFDCLEALGCHLD